MATRLPGLVQGHAMAGKSPLGAGAGATDLPLYFGSPTLPVSPDIATTAPPDRTAADPQVPLRLLSTDCGEKG